MRLALAFLAWLIVTVSARAADVVVQFSDEVIEYDQSHPAAGFWLGNLVRGSDTAVAAIDIVWKDDSGYSAQAIALALGALNTDCQHVDITDRQAAMVLKTPMIELQLEGAIGDDGQRFKGACTIPARGSMPETKATFEFGRSLRPMSLPTAAAFTGTLKVPGMGNLQLSMIFAQTPGGNWVGHADVPAQSILGLPLVNITQTNGLITAIMPIPVYPATIEAKIENEPQRLVGRFKQATLDLELDLPRDSGYVGPTLKRPQHPKPPFPYEAREVSVLTPAGFKLAGTLTFPKAGAPFAAAILITGSGQQDRDETLLGHKPFLVLADYLTRHGFAVLRCDDRGVGQSGGGDSLENCTSKDFADDVAAMVDFLKTQPEIDPARIGLIGHSEGGLIAPIVATARDDIAFIVLLAGPGVPGEELLKLQVRKLLEAEGMSAANIEQFSARQQKALRLALGDASEDEIRAEIAAMFEVDRETISGDAISATRPASQPATPAATQPTAAAVLQPAPSSSDHQEQIDLQYKMLTSPWMKFFLTFDPRPTLAKVKCPVLALNGALDTQVWHEQNLPEIEKAVRSGAVGGGAFGGGDVTIRRYEGLNHLFQPAKTGALSEYAVIETTMDERVMADIVEWLNQTLQR